MLHRNAMRGVREGQLVCSLQQRAHGSRTHDKEIFDIELGLVSTLVSTLVPCNE